MIDDLHKFPTTPHLTWLGPEQLRGDKVLTEIERSAFVSGDVALEEKIDGANLGISFSTGGELRFQNRGNWLEPPFRGQWRPLRDWAARHEPALRERLCPGVVLFGEWCYARHSVPYSRLPDWFLAFDVYDSIEDRFWSLQRRNALLGGSGISCVHQVATLRLPTIAELIDHLNVSSKYGDVQIEGLYLRIEENDWLRARAKLVNPDFVQAIDKHWSRSGIVPNQIDGNAVVGSS